MCLAAAVIGSAASLVLRWLVPLNPIGLQLAAIDGGLFEKLAVSLTEGDWLGSFDPLTLAKGPSYPAFVAATNRLHIPLQVGEQLTYLLGSLSLAASIWLVTRRLVAATAVYLILAFEPSNYSAISAHVLRDHWYGAIALLFLGTTFIAVYGALNFRRTRWALLAAGAAGLSGATFWLCREEGVWVVPSVLLVIAGLLAVRVLRADAEPGRSRFDRRVLLQHAARLTMVLVVVAATFYAPIAFVRYKNQRHYGVALTTDVSAGAFPEAYAAWSRVRGVPLRHLVPINRAQREAVYAVSPTARELRPRLEDPANGWAGWGCTTLNICDDFPGGAAIWAFRDAAHSSGNYRNAKVFQQFSTRLRDEIEGACDDGRLRCSMKLPPSLQPLQRTSVRPLLSSSWYWLEQLPVSPSVYTLYGPVHMNVVSDEERAIINRGLTGAPPTHAVAEAEAVGFTTYHSIYRVLGETHRVVFLGLLLSTGLALLLDLFWRRKGRHHPALWVLMVSLGVAIAIRLVIFAVIESTQYFGEMRYHYSTRTFLLALAATGGVQFVSRLRDLPLAPAWRALRARMPRSAPGSA